jgi:asparagine synthase (glutamine-hydrolysing)
MIEITAFLSSYLLCCQGDRVAMAHGVEVRYPFLDPEVVDFCNRLPRRMKLQGLRDKIALRRMASRELPEEIWNRPKKPYRAPMTTALLGPDAPEYVRELLSDGALRRLGLVDGRTASKLVEKGWRQAGCMSGEREEMALVGLLTLQLLGHFYLEAFAGRLAEARRDIERTRPSLLVDRTGPQGASKTADSGTSLADQQERQEHGDW